MKKKDIMNLVALVVVLSLATITYFTKQNSASKGAFILDTYVEIVAKGNARNLNSIIDSTFSLMQKYEEHLSFYKSEGELQHLNQQEQAKISNDIYELLNISENLFLKSDGLYDVSVGRLTAIWDFDNHYIPSDEEIQQALINIGFDKIEFDENSLRKPQDLKLNLGSLAKGFIIDKAVEFLQENGADLGFVNAGGDLRIFGQSQPLLIGIQHPRNDRNEIIGKVKVENRAIVTSGDYERFFEIEGVRYHHILNPKTGYPAKENISATVIADTAVLADAWSTAAFLMNKNEAIEAANSTDGVEVLIIFYEGEKLNYAMSSGMKEYIVDFELFN